MGVARDTDFLDLYRILDVPPGCELGEFKQAYRRRVVALHPDRRADDGPDPQAAERLQRLNALYGAAMIFERRHGRLPGAAQPRAARPATPAGVAPAARTRTPRRGVRRLLALVAAAAVGWLLWSAHPAAPAGDAGRPAPDPDARSAAATGVPAVARDGQGLGAPLIRTGTPAADVRQIEGEPLIISHDRWEYGPSWVRFERGRVVDWYSSPMRPLRTANATSAAP